jgi:hypothetical protein
MLNAFSVLGGLASTCAGVGALAFPDREMPAEEEERRWEPTIDELYSDGGGDA